MKILIAEDNPMWSKLLEKNAQRWKFDPIVVGNGREALERLDDDSSICMAILDWQMPEVSGIDVCRRIKGDSQRPFTYVMMLTSRDSKEDIITGLDAGADNYQTKPVDMAIVKSNLAAARRVVEAIPPKEWTKPQIDGYDVKHVIGKGAFATVWEATRESDGESVAIKILRVDLATNTVFERFAREVKVMQELNHRYIANVYESRVDRQLGYYVMDLIHGGTLTDYEKKHSPSPLERIGIVRRICKGLDEAHEKGIIHRDIKFSNVMMTDDGKPKIVDFGMSKSMFTPRGEDTLQTIEGCVLGTPIFMSPEQARGEIGNLDRRSDLYSAAVMLYILLLHKHPHRFPKNDHVSIVEAISRTHPRPPSELNPNFNAELEQILMKALEFEQANRYDTARQFADDLKAFLIRRASHHKSSAHYDAHSEDEG